ncbi:MAG: NUDIX hydrolase [Deltaproteobacteria bacterium]|nr:NUDIX hydrolase [Deltaproteobacteria bacterium]MBW1984858.1 NUDIX hydrolase [Deltaproteobacteria bacterium]MBW2180456.1 NUDIX hydrolase [Deltaproteobacteria bacterium]
MEKNDKQHKFAVIATDIVIFTIKNRELCVLLIKMGKEPFKGLWAVPGGLVKSNETVDSSAKRNLFKIVKKKDVFLEQLYTFGKIDRDPSGRVVSVAYFALLHDPDIFIKASNDNESIYWFPVNSLPKLAYDHKEIIHFAVERLRAKLTYTNIMFSLLPKEFTLSELQKKYEIILCEKLDKRNFRKKIMALNLVKKTDKRTSGKAHRPAHLYQFAQRSPKLIPLF